MDRTTRADGRRTDERLIPLQPRHGPQPKRRPARVSAAASDGTAPADD